MMITSNFIELWGHICMQYASRMWRFQRKNSKKIIEATDMHFTEFQEDHHWNRQRHRHRRAVPNIWRSHATVIEETKAHRSVERQAHRHYCRRFPTEKGGRTHHRRELRRQNVDETQKIFEKTEKRPEHGLKLHEIGRQRPPKHQARPHRVQQDVQNREAASQKDVILAHHRD